MIRRKRVFCAWIGVLAAVACVLAGDLQAQEREVSIAAAADLKFALDEMTAQFEKQTRVRVNATYGSSGNFFAQIQNGAPFDLFLSADIVYPRKLEEAGLAEPGSLFEYAEGRIVLWVSADSKFDLKKMGWHALLDDKVEKIAIANPEHAPYGRAAVAALQKTGIYERVKAKLVYGENISQAAQFVESGNAQAGIIALSLARSPEMKKGQAWEVPAEMHPPIQQAAVMLKAAANKNAAAKFLAFLRSEAGRRILEKYGFSVPPPAASKVAVP